MSTASNVTAGKPAVGGALYRAPIGTTLPTDATTALASAFVSLGHISEEGFKNNNSAETSSVKAWGGETVLNLQTAKPDTFTATLIEALNKDVLGTVYGEDNVSGTLSDGIAVDATPDEATAYVYVCDMIMRDNALKRIVIPQGKVTSVGEIAYSDSSAVGYPLTISAEPVVLNNKVKTHREFIKAASISGASSGTSSGTSGSET